MTGFQGFAELPNAMCRALEQRFSGIRVVMDDGLGMDGEEESEVGSSLPEHAERLARGFLLIKRLTTSPAEDAEPWRLAMQALFSLRLVFGAAAANRVEGLQLLEDVLVFLHQQRWRRQVGAARVIECVQEPGTPDADTSVVRRSWRIEWLQLLYLGRHAEPEVTPLREIHLGTAPRIGKSHKAEYLRLEVAQ